ncbi:MAG TPA: AraC family transcriptional regulator ligand-binding domain-containing protein, partial [Allosphingosinicella sp.]|nr:AraC family transcriptional regulator ligand-binding domain-containing protein [Allosphingosinicella sp.]
MTATATSRPSASPAESTIAAPFAQALLDLAEARGADPAALLRAVGLAPERLADREARIPVDSWVGLIRLGGEACGDPALALHFGEAFDVGDMSV